MPDLRNDIINALLSAFGRVVDFNQFLWIHWGVNVDGIFIADNLRSILAGVVDHFYRRGELLEFLGKACEEFPKNPKLADVHCRVERGEELYEPPDEDGGGGGIAVGTLKQTVVDLQRGLAERKNGFRYLNAYKELHEILHQLYSSRERIRTAMTSRMENPTQPLASDVVESLTDWVDRARSWYGETELTKREPEWIGRIEDSLKKLADSDASKWEKAFERLTNFQTRVMSSLNKDIVDNADRLEGDELALLCQAVFDCADETVPRQAKLRREVQQFRNRCSKMATLVEAHNLCQEVENSLQEANGLSVLVADELSEWVDVVDKFARLRELYPNSHQLICTWDAADVFSHTTDSDQAAMHYSTFKTHFDDLFHRTDQDLLDTCKLVYTSVDRLNDSLKEQFP